MSFTSSLHEFLLSSAKCMCQTSDKLGQEEEEEEEEEEENNIPQIRRSIMLDSHLTTYIPQAVNDIRYFLYYFTSERLRIFLSPQFEREKVRKTQARSGLESKTIQSRILGLSTWAICELTVAGGKKSIKPFRTWLPRTTCACIVALAAQRHNIFVSYFFG